MKNNKLFMRISSSLNFMNIVYDVKLLMDDWDQSEWFEPDCNFYVKRYAVVQEKKQFYIGWIDKNDVFQYCILRQPPTKYKILNKIYFKFKPVISFNVMDQRLCTSFLDVIFPDFCKCTGVTPPDFSHANVLREFSDQVLCSLYQNFFSGMSVSEFIDSFNLRGMATQETIDYVVANCNVK